MELFELGEIGRLALELTGIHQIREYKVLSRIAAPRRRCGHAAFIRKARGLLLIAEERPSSRWFCFVTRSGVQWLDGRAPDTRDTLERTTDTPRRGRGAVSILKRNAPVQKERLSRTVNLP
ncbi:hypothetical protein HPB51_025991 [Rhipicephalus microplus]|uniref:Uncharacterized protein n=1 Tax=Rhipicephalus microplus TaxID=6941 RepID=A0A9J6EE10_RHIMP|nr:hypothetical protein HPB51_025991 [Rhipicephalus microplus]